MLLLLFFFFMFSFTWLTMPMVLLVCGLQNIWFLIQLHLYVFVECTKCFEYPSASNFKQSEHFDALYRGWNCGGVFLINSFGVIRGELYYEGETCNAEQ